MHAPHTRPCLALTLLALAPLACAGDPIEEMSATMSATGVSSATASTGATTTDATTGESDTAASSSAGESTSTSAATTDDTTTGDSTASTGDSTTTTTTTTTTTGDTDTDTDTDTTGDTEGGLWHTPNLWYSVKDSLMYIAIDPMTGAPTELVTNTLVPDVPLQHGQNGLTMLEDGSLLGSREAASGTQIFHVPTPPITANTPADAIVLGVVPPDMGTPLRIEALYTDCAGRVYLMDSGKDTVSPDGNRLLRFTGDYLAGDLKFEVITDLQNASVADIDDMSPGIVDDEISDSLGFAMDSAVLWQIDYTTGTGMKLATTDGTWGIHALGGPLFADLQPRLYILSAGDDNTGAELLEVNLGDYSDGAPLIEGPDLNLADGYNGWSGLAGPLTECMSTIPQ